MKFCADWYVAKNEDGTFRNLDRVCSWVEIKKLNKLKKYYYDQI